MSYSNGPKIITNGLVLCLDAANPKSYAGSGTDWYDVSGNGNNGILANGPTFSSNNKGYITFDGTDDYVYTATQYTSFQYFTLSVWFKTTSTLSGKIIGFENTETGTSSNSYDRMIYIGTNGIINFGCYDFTTRLASSTSALNDGLWHHAVGTYNDSSKLMSLYIDGKLVSTTSLVTGIVTYTGYFRLGSYRFQNSWPYAADGYYSGSISSAAVYNRDLTANEVLQNYNVTKGRYNL